MNKFSVLTNWCVYDGHIEGQWSPLIYTEGCYAHVQ